MRVLIGFVIALVVVPAAWAFWTSAGTGSGSAIAGVLNPPTNVTATSTPGSSSVSIAWTAPSGLLAPQGYYVTRSNGTTSGTCASSPSTLIGGTSCNDAGLGAGTYSYTVMAVYHSWTASATSNQVTIQPLDHFTVSAQATATAGAPFSVTVTAKDSADATLPGYTGTVHFTTTDVGSGVVIPANYSFTSGDHGVHTFTNGVTLVTAGVRPIAVADTVLTSKIGGASVTISAAAASKLVFTQQPANAQGGTAFGVQPKVAVLDPFGNTVASDSSTASLSIVPGTPISGGAGTISGCAQTETNGVFAFSGCSINTAGIGYKIRATDSSLASADSTTFNVTIGPASQIVLTGSTSPLASGSTRVVTAAIEDAGGNTVTTGADASVTVTFAQTTGSGSLSGTGTSAAASGVATKTVTGNVAGSVTIRASSALSGPGTTVSNTLTFTVTSGTAAKLVVTQSPAGITSPGSAFVSQPIVTVEDAAGNTVVSDSGPVALSVTTGTGSVGAVLSCGANTSATAVNGVAAFTGCAINQAGTSFTLTAGRGGLTSGTSSQFDVLGTLTITTVVRDAGNKKVHFTGTGAQSGVAVTITICTVNLFPCPAGSVAGTSSASGGGANTGTFTSAQDSNNLNNGTNYWAQAVQGSRTSASFPFTVTTL